MKSCYRMLQGECNSDYTVLWRKVWEMKLPSKVLNFLWRLCRGCLPTNAALREKLVDLDVRCPWCYKEPETDVHVFFLCDFAKTVWFASGLTGLVQCSIDDRPCEVFSRLLDQVTGEQGIQIALIC